MFRKIVLLLLFVSVGFVTDLSAVGEKSVATNSSPIWPWKTAKGVLSVCAAGLGLYVGWRFFVACKQHYNDYKLFAAIIKNDHGLVKRLLGADVNVKICDDWTPLSVATIEGNLEIVKYLVEHNADVNAKKGVGFPPLFWATIEGNLEIVKYLVEHKADVTAEDKDGWTPLFWAVSKGNFEIVRYLIKNGADFAAVNKNRRTPADLETDPEIKEYLLTCQKFKSGNQSEIVKCVTDKLSVDNAETAKKNFNFLCEIVSPKADHPGMLYWIIKDKFKEYNQQKFGFTFKTPKEFYLHMLELYKQVPSKVLLDFCHELFRVCKSPLKFGNTSDNGILPFEKQLENRFNSLFVPKEKTADKQDVSEKYGKIQGLYNKEYRFPAQLATILNKKKFVDLKVLFKS